jgi:hypothetical protein
MSFLGADLQVIFKAILLKRNNKSQLREKINLTVQEKRHQCADYHMKIWLKWLGKGKKRRNADAQNAKAKNSH